MTQRPPDRRHPLDGSRSADIEDFEERVAIVAEGEKVDDETAAQIVVGQRLDKARTWQQRKAPTLFEP